MFFKQLFQDPGKLMNLVKTVGSKLDNKIKSGAIKESEFIRRSIRFGESDEKYARNE